MTSNFSLKTSGSSSPDWDLAFNDRKSQPDFELMTGEDDDDDIPDYDSDEVDEL